MVVGREEGPFSAPKALEAPMGELGPEPGALFVGVESAKHQGVRRGVTHTLHITHTKHMHVYTTVPCVHSWLHDCNGLFT